MQEQIPESCTQLRVLLDKKKVGASEHPPLRSSLKGPGKQIEVWYRQLLLLYPALPPSPPHCSGEGSCIQAVFTFRCIYLHNTQGKRQ